MWGCTQDVYFYEDGVKHVFVIILGALLVCQYDIQRFCSEEQNSVFAVKTKTCILFSLWGWMGCACKWHFSSWKHAAVLLQACALKAFLIKMRQTSHTYTYNQGTCQKGVLLVQSLNSYSHTLAPEHHLINGVLTRIHHCLKRNSYCRRWLTPAVISLKLSFRKPLH